MLKPGEKLYSNYYLHSVNNDYSLEINKSYGYLELLDKKRDVHIWRSKHIHFNNEDNLYLTAQTDGNIVIYKGNDRGGDDPYWSLPRENLNFKRSMKKDILLITNTGNLVVVKQEHKDKIPELIFMSNSKIVNSDYIKFALVRT